MTLVVQINVREVYYSVNDIISAKLVTLEFVNKLKTVSYFVKQFFPKLTQKLIVFFHDIG